MTEKTSESPRVRRIGGRRSERAKLPLIGAQISAAGGFAHVPERAVGIGAEAVQLFSSNPRTWRARIPTADDLLPLSSGLQQYGLPLFFHTIYLINLASPDEQLRQRSGRALAHALITGALTGAAGVVTHVGSHKGEGLAKATARVVSVVRAGAEAAREQLSTEVVGSALPPLLLENTSGSGHTVGGRFEELATLAAALSVAPDASDIGWPSIGLCLDTAHLFAAGYPVHEADGLERIIDELKRQDLLRRVGLVHLNDSATPFGSTRDWHENPGAGYIGHAGLARVVRHQALAHIPFILEVPGSAGHGPDAASVALVKSMREEAAGLPEAPAHGA